MKRKRISAREFCLVWNHCICAEEVARALGLPKQSVLSRASRYRRKGVRLKKLAPSPRKRLDVEGLNRLLGDAAPGGGAAPPEDGGKPEEWSFGEPEW